MQKKKDKLWFLFVAAVYFSMPAASLYDAMIQKMPIYELTAHLFISLILSFALVQYVKRSQSKQKRELPDKALFVLLFVGANFLMAVVKAENYGYLWLLPMIMLAIGVGVDYAMVVYVVLLAQNILLHVNSISAWELVTTVIYGAFCIWLMQQKLTVRVLPYLFISMLSVDGILQILKRQFQLTLLKQESKQLLIEVVSVLVLEVFIFCYVKYREGKDNLAEDTVGEQSLPVEETKVEMMENLPVEDTVLEEESIDEEEDIAEEDSVIEEEDTVEEDVAEETKEENISEEEDTAEEIEEETKEDSVPEEEDTAEESEEETEEESVPEEEDTAEESEEETEEESVPEEEDTAEEKSISEEESAVAEEESASEEENIPEETAKPERNLSDVLAENYGLRLRLQEYSESLFQHSLKISHIAEQAAAYMNGNVLLAKAGGLYHEIGRIADEKNYINAGERLLREDGCPEELIAVIRQHTASEKPQSLEAAIVLLADYIITTSDYLEKAGRRKEISDEKLVATIFNNRLSKGNLDEAGLSGEEIEQLREYFVELVFEV